MGGNGPETGLEPIGNAPTLETVNVATTSPRPKLLPTAVGRAVGPRMRFQMLLPDLPLHERRQGFDVVLMHKTAPRVDVQP